MMIIPSMTKEEKFVWNWDGLLADVEALVFVMRFDNPHSMAQIWAEIEEHGFLLFVHGM